MSDYTSDAETTSKVSAQRRSVNPAVCHPRKSYSPCRSTWKVAIEKYFSDYVNILDIVFSPVHNFGCQSCHFTDASQFRRLFNGVCGEGTVGTLRSSHRFRLQFEEGSYRLGDRKGRELDSAAAESEGEFFRRRRLASKAREGCLVRHSSNELNALPFSAGLF